MVLWFFLVLALEGLIVGALARLALPGPDPMGILATIGLGLAGSFVGGILSWLVLGHAGGLSSRSSSPRCCSISTAASSSTGL